MEERNMALYAFDGTWNSATLDDNVEQENETNVANFCEAYSGDNKFYVAGPGTRFGRVGRVLGGATGMGGFARVREAYQQLCTNWDAGDRIIDIVGFSRGAALAMDFANKIEDDGIRRSGAKEVIADRPVVRFLGLWDLVGSFGIPINIAVVRAQEINFGHKLTLPDNVEYCFHAMAMDERRQTFRVTRVLNGYEVWLRGVHSDIGGGNGNFALSNIARRWMLRKAKAAGLPIDDAAITACDHKMNPDAALCPPKDFIPNECRGFLKGDRFHYTVRERPNHNNPPRERFDETQENEMGALQVKDLRPREPEAAES
jgi:uncharacterized protein (DUF2235 family)